MSRANEQERWKDGRMHEVSPVLNCTGIGEKRSDPCTLFLASSEGVLQFTYVVPATSADFWEIACSSHVY
jgi:hypothetical protein